MSETLIADFQLEGFRIQARAVNLNRDRLDIRDEMLETIGVSGSSS